MASQKPHKRRKGVSRRRMAVIGGMAMMLCLAIAAGKSSLFTGATSESSVNVSLTVMRGTLADITAIPEKRRPPTGNNSTILTVETRTPSSTTPLTSDTVTTTSSGLYDDLVLGVDPGTYDVTVKGYSHLRRKLSSVALTEGVSLDFTSAGANPLLSGDVNSTNGDNTVNGIDLALIITGLHGATVRYDLNRDGRVNGIDLTNALVNLSVTGDS